MCACPLVDVEAVEMPAGDLMLSGLQARPSEPPTATIVALHGGGYGSSYWTHPLRPRDSLLQLGAQLGFRVIALDRPGYGATHGMVGDVVRMPNQARITLRLIESLRSGAEWGDRVFLVGHSMGAVLAVHCAAMDESGLIDAIDFSGLPLVFRDELSDEQTLEELDYMPVLPPEVCRALFYGPDGSFDPDIIALDCAELARPNPTGEIVDAVSCPADIPRLGPAVAVPVQYTLAEFEMTSKGGTDVLELGASMFTGSPRVVTQFQRASGHNISLHHVARAYHLRALAFFDEVSDAVAQADGGSRAGDRARAAEVNLRGGSYTVG